MKSTLMLMILLILSPSVWAKLDVFACEPEWGELTRIIGGKTVDVYTATSAAQDPHHIEARPSLIAKMRNAELVVCTGAELEIGWLPLLLRRSGNAVIQRGNPGYFEAAMQVERLELPVQLDRSEGDVHSSGNPHVHLDPYRVRRIAESLAERLQGLDAENSEHYAKNLADFLARWDKAILGWEEKAQSLKNMNILVYHNDWVYMNQWLGLNQIATIEPKPGIPPSARDQKRLLEEVKDIGLDAILLAPHQSDKAARWLASKVEVPIVILPYTVGGVEKTDDLFSLFEVTLQRLSQIHEPR